MREIYNTVYDFFQKVDIDGDKVVSREEFINIMKNLKLNFTSTDMNAIWLQLDKSNNGKAYALNFKTLFLPFINEDLRFFIMDLYRLLDNQGLTFAELMRGFTKNVYIQFSRLIDAIKSISIFIIYIFFHQAYIIIYFILYKIQNSALETSVFCFQSSIYEPPTK